MENENEVVSVINMYADMVYRIALTRTGSVPNAEDIFQEVFLKYSEKAPKFTSEEHRKAWLIRVAINLSKNFNNSMWNKKTVKLEDLSNLRETNVNSLDKSSEYETLKANNVEIDNTFSDSNIENEVLNAVGQLPQNYRTVIYLMYYEGYKVKEIAELMNSTEGTIKTWAFRAREILKEQLEGGF